MQIEVGKFYKTRGGYKFRVYATDGGGDYPIHGAYLIMDRWSFVMLTKEGAYNTTWETTDFDLISEWVETPEVDWSLYPKWWDWIAMDADGEWYGYYNCIPTYEGDSWWYNDNGGDGSHIPPQYAPKYNGHAKDSLVKRPQ